MLGAPFGCPAASPPVPSERPVGFAPPPRGGFAFSWASVVYRLYAPWKGEKYLSVRTHSNGGAAFPWPPCSPEHAEGRFSGTLHTTGSAPLQYVIPIAHADSALTN